MLLIKVLLFFCYCFSSKNILLSLAPFSLGQAIQINFEKKRKHSDSANEGRKLGEEQNSKRRKKKKSFDSRKKSTKSKKKSIQSQKDKTYECEFCLKMFSSLGNRKTHEKNIHNKKTQPGQESNSTRMEQVCTECDKIFFNAWDLMIHERVHSGKKPYACNVCDKAFSQVGTRNRHKKDVHREDRSVSDVKMDNSSEWDVNSIAKCLANSSQGNLFSFELSEKMPGSPNCLGIQP